MSSKHRQNPKKNGMGKENRSAGERIPIQLLVDYKAEGNYLFDFCRDLGQGGIFIETKQPKPIGQLLELTFTIPDSKETVKACGRVIWVQAPIPERSDLVAGMGLQFEAFSPQDRKILESFVRRYSRSLSKSA